MGLLLAQAREVATEVDSVQILLPRSDALFHAASTPCSVVVSALSTLSEVECVSVSTPVPRALKTNKAVHSLTFYPSSHHIRSMLPEQMMPD